jgi:hypothetical protein
MVFVEFDYSAWPRLNIIFAETPMDNEEFDDYTNEFKAALNYAESRREEISIVFDTTTMRGTMGPKYLIAQAKFLGKCKPLLATVLACSAVVTPEWVRPWIDAVMTIHKPTKPNKIVSSTAEALKFTDTYVKGGSGIDRDDVLDFI